MLFKYIFITLKSKYFFIFFHFIKKGGKPQLSAWSSVCAVGASVTKRDRQYGSKKSIKLNALGI